MKKQNPNKQSFTSRLRGAAVLSACSLSLLLASCSNQPASSSADYIGIDAAKEAALNASGLSSGSVSFSSAGLDSKNNIFYYEVVFSDGTTQWEYDIDALTGVVIEEKILSQESAAESETAPSVPAETQETAMEVQASAGETQAAAKGTQPSSSSSLDSNSALSIALAHAGLTEEDLVFSKVEPDFDDGISIIDVEFVSKDGTEYDYELRADDGVILSFDQDAELKLPPVGKDSGIIEENQAKDAVLSRVPGAAAEDITIFLEEDDGRLEYKGRLLYEDMLYEFKIDPYSGILVEWEAERVFVS